MAKSRKDHLLAALDELTEEELKRFKRKLNDVEVESGYNRIPRGKLDKADRIDVADLVVSFYTVDYGILVVLRVLDEINQKDVANELRKKIKEEGGTSGSTAPPRIPSEEGSAVRPSPAAKHFVDRHRVEIISRNALVDPILDRLYSLELLTAEQYDVVRSKDTAQNKMRELYRFVDAWATVDKDQLYHTLKKENAPLIRDLGGQ